MPVAFKTGSDQVATFNGVSSFDISLSGTATGDYSLLHVYHNGTSTMGTPSGWTAIHNISAAGGRMYVFGRYWSSSPPSTQSVTISSSLGGYATISSFTGVNSSNPIYDHETGSSASGTFHTSAFLSGGGVGVDALVYAIFKDQGSTGGPNFTAISLSAIHVLTSSVDSGYTLGRIGWATYQNSSVRYDSSSSTAVAKSTIVLRGIGPPTFSSGPGTTYTGSHAFNPTSALTRIGPSNAGRITFTPTDSVYTGSNQITWEVRTSDTPDSGTLITSGTATSGVSKTVDLTTANTGFNTSGTKTVYLHLTNASDATTVSSALTFYVDLSTPTSLSAGRTGGGTIYDDPTYTVTLSATDTMSPSAGELRYQIRTATGGGGTLLAEGYFTSGVAIETATITDSLSTGSNTRYLRVEDGGGNVAQSSFTVTFAYSIFDETAGTVTITAVTGGSDTFYPAYDERAGTQVILATITGSDAQSYVWNETSGLMTVLAVQSGTDTQQWIWTETAGAQTVLVVQDGIDYPSYIWHETDGTQTVLVVQTYTEQHTYIWNETAGESEVLVLLSGYDSSGWMENTGSVIVLATLEGTETLDIVETDGTAQVLVLIGGTDGDIVQDIAGTSVVQVVTTGTQSILDIETAGAEVIQAVLTGTDTTIWGETSGTSVVLVTQTGTFHITHNERGGVSVVPVILSGYEMLSWNEESGTQIVLVQTDGTDILDAVETAGTSVVLVVLGGTEQFGGFVDESAGVVPVVVVVSGTDTIALLRNLFWMSFDPVVSYVSSFESMDRFTGPLDVYPRFDTAFEKVN